MLQTPAPLSQCYLNVETPHMVVMEKLFNLEIKNENLGLDKT